MREFAEGHEAMGLLAGVLSSALFLGYGITWYFAQIAQALEKSGVVAVAQ